MEPVETVSGNDIVPLGEPGGERRGPAVGQAGFPRRVLVLARLVRPVRVTPLVFFLVLEVGVLWARRLREHRHVELGRDEQVAILPWSTLRVVARVTAGGDRLAAAVDDLTEPEGVPDPVRRTDEQLSFVGQQAAIVDG